MYNRRQPLGSFRSVIYTALALALLVTATILGLMKIEGMLFTDSLWLTVVSITTVGFGDVVPSTQSGRIILMMSIMAGVGLFTYLLGTILVAVMEGHLKDIWGRDVKRNKQDEKPYRGLRRGTGWPGRDQRTHGRKTELCCD